MMQSSFDQETSRRLHVAIVMDGNGRWAEARGLPRTEGHRRGEPVAALIRLQRQEERRAGRQVDAGRFGELRPAERTSPIQS